MTPFAETLPILHECLLWLATGGKQNFRHEVLWPLCGKEVFVLRSMKSFVTKALLAGQVVVLQDIGRFQVTLQGKCYTREVMNEEGFSPASMIRNHRIVFRPEARLKDDVAAGISLKRVASEAMA